MHYTCAIGMFLGFTIYALINTFYIDSKLKETFPEYPIPISRKLSSLLNPVLMFGFCVFDRTGHFMNTAIPREALGSIFEIGLVLCFAIWIASLKGSTGGIKFKFEPSISPTLKLSRMSDFKLYG